MHASQTSEESRNSRAEPTSRSEESRRAEKAHPIWSALPPSQRPLAIGRGKAADAFDGVLNDRWLADDLSATNVALADRHLGIDEKQVRQWRENEKPLPFGAVYAMPPTIAEGLLLRALDEVRRGRGPGARRVLVKLVAAHDELKRTRIPDADVEEARGVLRSLAKDIAQMLATLEAE